MPTLDSIKSLEFVLVFMVPGLVALYARSQFLTGRLPELKEAAPSYLALTLVYYALTYPFFAYVVSIDVDGPWRLAMWFGLVFLGPIIFGSVLGVIASRGIIRAILSKFGFRVVHPMPTAWDYKLGDEAEQYVLVKLKDGTEFAGIFGGRSFASSDPNERDLYIEKVFDLSKTNQWKPRKGNGVWLKGEEIQSIEFWSFDDLGD